jgi:hypothetical protein
LTDYAAGYMLGVTQASTSTIGLDYLVEMGIRKANSKAEHMSKNSAGSTNRPYAPYVRQPRIKITEYEKGWLEGVEATFAAFAAGEINIDATHEDFIPLKVINFIISKSEKDELAKIAERNKKEEERKDGFRQYPSIKPPHMNNPEDYNKPKSKKIEDKLKAKAAKEAKEAYKKHLDNYYHKGWNK